MSNNLYSMASLFVQRYGKIRLLITGVKKMMVLIDSNSNTLLMEMGLNLASSLISLNSEVLFMRCSSDVLYYLSIEIQI